MLMGCGRLFWMRCCALLFLVSVNDAAHDANNKDWSTTIVYTSHMKWDVAIVMSMLFLLAAGVTALKVFYMALSSRLKTWHVRLFYAVVVAYTFARGVFFVVVKLTMPVELYYFTWFLPILLYICGYVLLTRLWSDVHAESRNLFRLKYRRLRGALYLSEYVLLVVLVAVHLLMFLVLVLFPDNEYKRLQTIDLVWLITCGMAVLLYATGHFVMIKVFVRQELRAGNPDVENAAKGVTIGLISRADMVFAIWSLALLARLADLGKALDPSADRTLAESDLFWVFICPFYVLAELIPALVLLVDTTGFSTTKTLQDIVPSMKRRRIASSSSVDMLGGGNIQSRHAHERDALLDVAMNPRVAHWTILFSDIELVGSPIGAGVSGEVFRAVWHDSVVAVKQLRSIHGRDLEDFCDEILILSSLRHANIVRFLGAVIEPPRHICIVSEFLERGSLRSVIDDPRVHIDLRLALEMASDICRGMSFIHASDIIHRDLKPENLLLDKDFNVKIGDFGISKVRDFKNVTGGFVMTCVGSGSYIAPEVLLRQPYTQKADVFSFGIIFWELLCRRRADIYADDCIEGKRPALKDNIPPFLQSLLERCWHSKYRMRPAFPEVLTSLKSSWAQGEVFLSQSSEPTESDFSPPRHSASRKASTKLLAHRGAPPLLRSKMKDLHKIYGNESHTKHGLAGPSAESRPDADRLEPEPERVGVLRRSL